MRGNEGAEKRLQNIAYEKNFSFARHTAYGCGGCAAIAYFPRSVRQSEAVFDFLSERNTEFVALGNGSNVLASEKDFDGAVICMKRFTGMYPTGENRFFCRAGTNVVSILNECADRGYGGLEYLAGIPATCGGLLFMNGGASGKSVSENVESVLIYDGKLRKLSNKNCRFGQKYSIMRDMRCLILGAEFTFMRSETEKIREEIASCLKKRSAQPKGRSCGCVFKNVGSLSAGKLIDEAGLKGLSVGGAIVSNQHANFILNRGASASDVYALIREVKRLVRERTGVCLEDEVVYIGDFNDTFG